MKRFYILIFVLYSFNEVNAQWQLTSATNNSVVNVMAASGTNIYAGSHNGVFLSNNSGSTWTKVNIGSSNTTVGSLAISGSNIFAGTDSSGIFLSTNNGITWTAINTGIPANAFVTSIAVMGTNIFAASYGNGVFLSSNNGTTWSAVNNGLTNTFVSDLSISGTNIIAGTESGIFISGNNGTSWTSANNGLPNIQIYSLNASGSNIYAGGPNGIFLSTNNGANWITINNGLPVGYPIISIAINGTDIFVSTYNVIYGCEIYLSTNNGSNWTKIDTGMMNAVITSFAFSGMNVFAGACHPADWNGVTISAGIWKRPLSELTAISETNAPANFTISPNPASTNLCINLQQLKKIKNTIVSIFDIQGQLILQQNIEQSKTDINIEQFATGVYVVKIMNDKNTMISKFIKK
ncbi:MAG: T9SS type A sorting domain-containing protein [Bacteroidetes bacterium]|nr:T9SS type A sorting domain-containing protein [Bacteroidota bacterium]